MLNSAAVSRATVRVLSPVLLLALAACGNSLPGNIDRHDGGGGGGAVPGVVSGVVEGAAVKYPTGFANSSAAGVDYAKSTTGDSVVWSAHRIAYSGATVCVDGNDNGFCDAGEDAAVSRSDGSFSISTAQSGALTAIVNDGARKLVLRAAADARSGRVAISGLSTEVLHSMQADSLGYDDARKAVAQRLSFNNTPALPTDVTVTPEQVSAGTAGVTDAGALNAMLFEDVAQQNRAASVATILDRGYASELAVDPVKNVQDAQKAAYAPEDIPRYDHLFVVIFENHPNTLIDLPTFPNFYNFLNVEGNKASNYFSVGNPSEPNYVALASGDDWGISGDSAYNCMPDDDAADHTTDVYDPRGACSDSANHNQKGRRNMFTALYNAGLGARVYSESMDPGQDPRLDGQGNADITGPNKTVGRQEPFIPDLYKIKHQPAMFFDEVRNRPDFFRNLNRTIGGGQWDAGIEAYAKGKGMSWNVHQFEDDLKTGDVGALNYIIPDQCDDDHTTGTEVFDCTQVAYLSYGILRADSYAKYVVDQIKASPVWTNTARKSAIVLIFDEGSFFLGSSSCCGWNSGGGNTSGAPLDEGITTPVPAYVDGNKGDGPTIFALLTNQPKAPKGVHDSDSYSHISFVRTMQDMFGLADPGVPTSYMNRSKYTESYIAAHLDQLTEYKDSADPHFDAVRPMNHAYVMKAGDRLSGGLTPGSGGSGSYGIGGASLDFFALGPDVNQTNIWALK